jgi:hypothetical protein
MRKKARTTVNIAGQNCSALDEIMVSPLMLKVNGPHEKWPKHATAPQVAKHCGSAH